MASTPLTNRALWQDTPGVPGVVRENKLPELGEHKVLIKVHAWAINPCDHMLQDKNMARKYPLVLGCDVAGTVEAVGSESTKFTVGDRVFGSNANGCFTDYVALEDRLMAKMPEKMSYSEAVGLGFCSATAAMYLFGKNYLHLDFPTLGAPRNGKKVVVWGGGSAVGSNAIQLAAAAGYDVLATCSGHNFEHVEGLGAVHVFDYKDPEVTEKMVAELDKGECVGVFMAAGLDAGNAAALSVAIASKQTVNFCSSNFIAKQVLDEPAAGVDIKQLTPDKFVPFPDCWLETTRATFEGYLPEALSKGAYKVAPAPLVINRKGVEGLQEGIDMMRAVSEKGLEGVKQAVKHAADGAPDETVTVVKVVVERP